MDGGMAQSCWLLLTLSLKGILAGDWSVHLPSGPICAVIGSSVVLPCSYDYPQSSDEARGEGWLSAQGRGGEERQEYKVLSEMWCLEDSRCITPSYVYHSDHIFPDPNYENRAQYLGQPGTKNCSLMITNLTPSDSGTYVFYLITNHSTEKMPEQTGVQLLVADSSSGVTALRSPSREITEGATLRLACCSPVADPQAHFSWYKSTSTSIKHIGQVWNITEVTSDDSGSYYCQIQTGDNMQNSTVLPVDVQYSPRNTTVSVSPAGQLHYELPMTLTCSSDANPPVHAYIWYQGAACLDMADKSFHQGRQTVATTTSSRTFNSANITIEEYGVHCCVARNRHGSQTFSITLRGSRAVIPSLSAKRKGVIVGVFIGILLPIIVIAAFLIRRQKSSRHQSYVLTETTMTEP